jgi:hypothetical protein
MVRAVAGPYRRPTWPLWHILRGNLSSLDQRSGERLGKSQPDCGCSVGVCQRKKKGACPASPGITIGKNQAPGSKLSACYSWRYAGASSVIPGAGRGLPSLHNPRIPLVRQRPPFLRSRHLSRSDAATAVKGAKRDRSHAQPQASMARTSPLTAGGRGVATLFVGCGTYVRRACAGPLTCVSWCEDLMTGPAMRQGTGFTPACKISPDIACILLRDQPRQNRNIKEWRGVT